MRRPAVPIDLTEQLIESFWKLVKKTRYCWEWIGAKSASGYGVLSRGRVNNSALLLKAHRVSWLLHNGSLSEDLLVCHHCDNKSCVNPNHLFLGTNTDNVRDAWKKGRGSHPPVFYGKTNNKTKLTEKQVREIRKNYRYNSTRTKSECSLNGLARRYDVSKKTILNIVHRKVWKWLT